MFNYSNQKYLSLCVDTATLAHNKYLDKVPFLTLRSETNLDALNAEEEVHWRVKMDSIISFSFFMKATKAA